MNSTGRLGEASVKHHFSILTRPSSALAYRTYPVPRIRKLHVFTQLLSPLLYYIICFCGSSRVLGTRRRRQYYPGVYSPRSLLWVRDDIGKYDSDMTREKLIAVPPPSPGPFNDSADRYADWKSLLKLACTAFSVQRPRSRSRNWLFLQNGPGGRLYSASGCLLQLARPLAVLAIRIIAA